MKKQKVVDDEGPEVKLIGYARVSTEEQHLGMQIDALLAHGIARADIYSERVSSAKQKRAELEWIIDAVLREGDTLVVWKIDRLARNMRDLHRLLERVAARGATFRSLTQSFDTATAIGRMMLNILGVFAEFERDTIRERTREGVKRAKAEGKQIGNTPILNKQQAREIKAARKLPKRERPTLTALAKQYDVTPNTIRNYATGRSKPKPE